MEFLIASRTTRPADDPIFALNAEASARHARGESIVNATVGVLLDDDGRLAVLPTVAQVFRDVPAIEAAGYAPLAGPAPFLAATIDELLGGSPFAEHAIAVATPGGTGALRHVVANFLDAGDALLTTSFYWGPYRTIADENGRRVDTFSMFTRLDTEGELDVASLEAALDRQIAAQKRVLLVLNDPCQNPTGYSMRAAEWNAVVDVVGRASTRAPITVACDVAYYRYGAGDPRAFLSWLSPLLGRVALAFAWTASKSYTQYGARVGSLIVVDPDAKRRKRTFDALSFSCRGTWSNCNHAGMLAIARVIGDETLRAKVDAERALLKALLDARVATFNDAACRTHLRYPRYDGGFFTTVFVPPGKSVQQAAAALREKGVFVVPQGDGLRVALCSVARSDVLRLVDALVSVLG